MSSFNNAGRLQITHLAEDNGQKVRDGAEHESVGLGLHNISFMNCDTGLCNTDMTEGCNKPSNQSLHTEKKELKYFSLGT